MKSTFAIFAKEILSIFGSFSAYLILALFSFVTGAVFFANIHDFSAISGQLTDSAPPIRFEEAVLAPYFLNICLVLLILVPVITMKTFSDERRLGTYELLFTYPVSDFSIVLGKWLALVVYVFFLISPSGIYFMLLAFLEPSVQFKVLLLTHLGLWLIGAMSVTIGMLFSSLTESTLVSIALSFCALMFFWVLGWIADWLMPSHSHFIKEFWIWEHVREFSRGIFDIKRFWFYLLGTVFFLFATVLSLESRSWRR